MALRPYPRIVIGLSASILLLVVCASAQQGPREIFERARLLDESNQNLVAIKFYNQVVSQAKDHRQLAARAQYRIGVLYERLNRKADAQRAFKAVVSQFPDQTVWSHRAQAKIITVSANAKKADNTVIKQTGASADGWYKATFTALADQIFKSPVIDSVGRRLYALTWRVAEPQNEAERRRISDDRGLRNGYEPSSLIVIDTERNLIVKTIPLSVYIDEIAFNPANNKIYATAQVNGDVKVIDAGTFAQITIDLPGQPTTVAVNATTNRIYVTSQGFAGNDKLFVIDGATNAIAGPYELGGVAGRLVVNSATNRIYAFAPPKTRVFNGADNSAVADLAGIKVMGADSVHNLIYAVAADASGNVQALDGNTHSLIATLGLSSLISSIGIDANTKRLYAAVEDKNQIAVIDTNTHTEVGRLFVAEAPQSLAVDPSTGHVYISHLANPRIIGVLAGRDLEGEIQEEFSDVFDSTTLDSSWAVLSGQGGYSLTENPGHLRFRAARPSGAKPLLLISRKFRGEYWTLEVKASYATGVSGGSRNLALSITFGAMPAAGLLGKPINRTTVNGAYIFRVRDDWDGCCPGEIRQAISENGKSVSFNFLPPNSADIYVWRIKRNGRTITIERSDDGINFAIVDSHTFGTQIEGAIQFLGIGYDSHANDDAYVDYDYVRLRKSKLD